MINAVSMQLNLQPPLIRLRAGSLFASHRKKCLRGLPITPPWGIGFHSFKRLPFHTRVRWPPGESTIGTARHITMKGGLTIVETVVYWHPPHCYAYKAEGTHLPFKNYLGLFQVEPIDDQSGKFIFREYFDGAGRVGEALLPHGVAAVFHKALGNLARLIGGTEYAMTAVSRA